MRGIRGQKSSLSALGGFTEAVMALMVVTIAVILLSTSLSFTGVQMMMDGDERSLAELCEDLIDRLYDDKMLWSDRSIVSSSFEERSKGPYEVPEGSQGYLISLIDNSIAEGSIEFGVGIEVEGSNVHVKKLPISIKTQVGDIHPGTLEVTIW